MIAHGPMLLADPVGDILRGICFEGSSFDKSSFYVWMFWMPLYVLTDELHLTLGKRICGDDGERWNGVSVGLLENMAASIQSDALPFLRRLETSNGLVETARDVAAESRNPHAQETLAYVLARVGKTDAAIGEIDVLLDLLDAAVPWQEKLEMRAKLVRGKLLEGPERAAEQLDRWRVESVRKLGLEVIS